MGKESPAGLAGKGRKSGLSEGEGGGMESVHGGAGHAVRPSAKGKVRA